MDSSPINVQPQTGVGPIVLPLVPFPIPPTASAPNWGTYCPGPPTPYPASGWDSPIWTYGRPELTNKNNSLIDQSDTSKQYLQSVTTLAQLLGTSIRSGQGLAAPQVGNAYRMFIFYNSIAPTGSGFQLVTKNAPVSSTQEPYQVIINPVIIPISGGAWYCETESCMSFPQYSNEGFPAGTDCVQFGVPRWMNFEMTYCEVSYGPDQSITKLTPRSYIFPANTDPTATEFATLNWVLQHETDHVNGVLFIDHAVETNVPAPPPLAKDQPGNKSLLQQIQAGQISSDAPQWLASNYQLGEGQTIPS